MRLWIVLSLACACATHPFSASRRAEAGNRLPGETSSVTFGPGSIGVGTTEHRLDSLAMSLRMRFAAEGKPPLDMSLESAQLHSRRQEVLAVAEGAPTELRVLYDARDSFEFGPDGEKRTRTALDGAYRVGRVGPELSMLREDGRALSAQERGELEADFRDLAVVPDLGALSGRTVAIGEAVEVDARVTSFATLFGKDMPGSLRVVLRETRAANGREEALFDAVLSLQGPFDNGEMQARLEGTATVDVGSGRLTELLLTGLIAIRHTGEQKGRIVDISSAGRMRLSMKRRYA